MCLDCFFGQPDIVITTTVSETRILVLGLDNAGKTTFLYKLNLGPIQTIIPTMGWNIDLVEYGFVRGATVSFLAWDVGGQEKIRPLWEQYYRGADALFFVVDSADREHVDEAREELQYLLRQPGLGGAKLVVLANKQDLPGAMRGRELAERLGLYSTKRYCFVQEYSTRTDQGQIEVLQWLGRTLPSLDVRVCKY